MCAIEGGWGWAREKILADERRQRPKNTRVSGDVEMSCVCASGCVSVCVSRGFRSALFFFSAQSGETNVCARVPVRAVPVGNPSKRKTKEAGDGVAWGFVGVDG